MLTYIIEDDDLKAENVRSFIEEHFPHMRVFTFCSYNSGLRAIESKPPELIILDMRLPTFDYSSGREGRQRELGGYDIMRKMKRRNIISPVIVLTQLDLFGEFGEEQITFEDVSKRCRLDFPNFFIDSIYYSPGSMEWADKLLANINGLDFGGGGE